MKLKLTYLFPLLVLLLNGCNDEDAWDIVKTRGAHKTEVHQLATFHELKVGNGINVVLKSGDSPFATLDGWENLLPKVKLSVNSDGLLSINDDNSFNVVRNLSNRTTVYLTYNREINTIYMQGDGLISTDGELETSNLTILSEDASGSVNLALNASSLSIGTNHRNTADITLSGRCISFGITNWGNAPINMNGLTAQYADITHHGAADLYVNVAQILSVTLTGIGDIYYTGNPTVTLNRKGKGNLYQK